MTNLEYMRQFPGCGDCTFRVEVCPIGTDTNCCGDCEVCEKEEATIGGKPAPYMFVCPVKPRQTVYFIRDEVVVVRAEVAYVSFFGRWSWRLELFGHEIFYGRDWNVKVFPTREAAEAKLAEMSLRRK